MIEPPKKFIGLHAHSGASVSDGLGPPKDHIDFVLENGMDAWAETNHGHCNSFANASLYAKKLKAKGVKFKYIPGAELYVHPDLDQWRREKQQAEDAKLLAKEEKKLAAKQREKVITEIERKTDENDETIEMTNSMTIENEEETKSGKTFNPINRRHHIVVLPKNSVALSKLFRLVSKGYTEGFYRFPRIDLKMLKEISNGENDLIISSACLGGFLSYSVFEQLRQIPFESLHSSLLDDASILGKCVTAVANTFGQYADAVGRGNVMLELQFNRLPAQDVVNRAIMEFAKQNSLTDQLVVTADSHYARPELWKHREMYKKLGYINYSELGPESLPKSIEDLKCELYPKNASQVWAEYNKTKERSPFYTEADDELICAAIERTHDIAHEVIGEVTYDTSYKYPKTAPEGVTDHQELLRLCREGMIRKGLHKKPEYIERMKHELGVIKKLKNSSYFVLMAKVMEKARERVLCGVARGSAGGSLVCYLCDITDLDPIKHECRFDRFMSLARTGAPDVDVDVSDRDKVLEELRNFYGYNNVLPVSNINRFKLKTLVKDLAKFYGIPYDEVNAATRTVEQEVKRATHKQGDDKNIFELKFNDAMEHSPSFKAFIDKYPELTESIHILLKEQRSLGRHAGGVLILDDASKHVPIITAKGEPQVPFSEGVNEKTLEVNGLLKIDLLGLETMRLIERSIELVIRDQGGVVEVEIDGTIKHFLPDDKIKLIDGTEKLAKDLNEGDEISQIN